MSSSVVLRAGAVVCRRLPGKLGTWLAYRLARVNASGTVRHEVDPGVVLDLQLCDWMQRLYYLGEADQLRLRLLKSMIPEGGTVADIGANVGLYACVLARHVGPRGRVVAFEPMPQNVGLLKRNIEINGLTNVKVFPVALSDRVGTVDLYAPATGSIGPSAATRIQNPGDWPVVGSAEVTTLDETFEGHRLDLIKIDVEGHEAAVLDGARNVIKRFRPMIVCEVHPQNRRWLSEFASAQGYRVLAESPDGFLAAPSREAFTDLFLVPDALCCAQSVIPRMRR